MDKVSSPRRALTFNGPLEAGVRAVAILYEAFPASFDLQRLVAFDYLLVRTEQLGGPDDLHPSGPIQTPAAEVRRGVVQSAISLMMTRNLIDRDVAVDGIRYRAGESAAFFISAMETPYLCALRERASWVVKRYATLSDFEFNQMMRGFLDNWLIEFQAVEHSLGESE
jgi:hypothetical protein